MTTESTQLPAIQDPLVVPSGVPGLDLVHFLTWTEDDMLPFDGEWSVSLAGRNIAAQRCRFRTLHAAAHYAKRIGELADWTGPHEHLFDGDDGAALRVEMDHAEAHAHEVDAVWPIGALIPFSNGPSIVDDDGTTRAFLRGAPMIDWEKGDDGLHRCGLCGEYPKIRFDWMQP